MKRNDLSQLACFKLQNSPTVLDEWEGIFFKYPAYFHTKGTELTTQDMPVKDVFYIREGLLEYIYTDVDGEEHLINLGKKGESYGIPELFSKEKLSWGTLRTLTDAVIVHIPQKEFYLLIEQMPHLYQELLQESSRITETFVMQRFSCSKNADRRIVEIIFQVCSVLAREQKTKTNIRIPLNQTDIARISGMTRVTASKVLKRLKESRLLDITYGGLLIWDIDQLEEYIKDQP